MFPRCPHSPRALAIALMTTLCVGACDEEPEPETTETEDRIVFGHTHTTLETVPLLAFVADSMFKSDPSWKSLDGATAQRVAVLITRARLELVLGSLQCASEFDSDGMTYLNASFSSCKLVGFDLEGTFEAEVAVETEPCDANETGECAVAVRWSLAGPRFAIGKEGKDASHFVGPVLLRDPIDATQRMTWETQSGFSLQAADGEQFATRSSASWLIDEATECMAISLDARLEIPAIEDQGGTVEGIEIGEIVISATNVLVCPGECPPSGRIEMAYGNGSLLSWEYDGSEDLVVTGPGGREFQAKVTCPMADAPAP